MEIRPLTGGRQPHHSGDRLLWRRLAAGVVDLTLVVMSGIVVAERLVERFSIIREDDGSHSFTVAEQERINELAGLLSRGYEFGDTLLALSTTSVLTIAAAIVLAGACIGVLIPVLTDGQSIGKKLFGLRVVGTDGSTPSLIGHALRTVAGLADLMPLIVPGLTGFAFAASNSTHQRIGDRMAGTVVVDCRTIPSTSPADPAPVANAHQPRTLATIESTREVVVHPRHLLATGSEPKLNSDRQKPDQTTSEGLAPDPSLNTSPDPDRRTLPGPQHQHHGDRIEMSDNVNAERRHEPTIARAAARRVPVEERSTNPYPKPIRAAHNDSVAGSEEVGPVEHDEADSDKRAPGYDSLALPESSLSDMPLTNTALFEALGLSQEDIAKLDATAGEPDSEPTTRLPDPSRSETVVSAQPAEPPGFTHEINAVPERETVVPEALRARPQPTDAVPEIASARQFSEPDQSQRPSQTNLNPPRPVSPTIDRPVAQPIDHQPPHPFEQQTAVSPAANASLPISPAEVPTQLQPSAVVQPIVQPMPTEADDPQNSGPLPVDDQPQPQSMPDLQQPHERPLPPLEQPEAQVLPPLYEPQSLPTTEQPELRVNERRSRPTAQETRPQPQPTATAIATFVDEAESLAEATEKAAPRQASSAAPDKRSPIWSEDWEAWIYWDTTLKTWFHHDDASGNWVPMEE